MNAPDGQSKAEFLSKMFGPQLVEREEAHSTRGRTQIV